MVAIAVACVDGEGVGDWVIPGLGMGVMRRVGIGVTRRLGMGVTPKVGIGVTRRVGAGVMARVGIGVTRRVGMGVIPGVGEGVIPRVGIGVVVLPVLLQLFAQHEQFKEQSTSIMPRENCCSIVQISKGMVPTKLLLESPKNCSDCKFPSSQGIVPVRLLSIKER